MSSEREYKPTTVFDEGYHASFGNRPISANPYPAGTKNHQKWALGWEACRLENIERTISEASFWVQH